MSCRYREPSLIPPDDNPVVEMVCNGALIREEFKDGSVRWSDSVGLMPSTLQDVCDDAYAMCGKVMEQHMANLRANVQKAIDDSYALGAFQAAEVMATRRAR